MPPEMLIVILYLSLFLVLYFTIKLLVDARKRNHLIQSGRSDELIQAYLAEEKYNSRVTSLRLGLVLLFLAGGLALIDWLGLQEDTTTFRFATLAILVGGTGLGNLLFFLIEAQLKKRADGK